MMMDFLWILMVLMSDLVGCLSVLGLVIWCVLCRV